MTNDNEQAGSRIENKLRELVQAQAAAEAWARDNDLVIAQAVQIEQLKAERALLVEALELDLTFHGRPLVISSIDEFRALGYTGPVEGNPMRQFLHDLKCAALAKAGGAQ
jgi:hypothetical protein